ncbi:hypothetical protein [Sansalvadorimonas verongulae]|uniref:hypothetical protein n=1 Tax=Sansalvadorimonas verongulae TaxID=2172824 RepID=UPI0012BB9AB5|nr:hypothetical protein [Sansalvadorimonas verongulae]MTI12957.1 hypothetical protein [Sansalvadorimonas verongulae]
MTQLYHASQLLENRKNLLSLVDEHFHSLASTDKMDFIRQPVSGWSTGRTTRWRRLDMGDDPGLR